VPDKNKISAEIARTAVAAAESLDAAVIAAVTMSGRTVRAISSLHPEKPIAGMAPSDKLLQHMTLQFGVIPIPIREGVFAGEFQIKQVMKSIKANNLGEKGNLMIYTAGLPAGSAHNTNTLCIREIE
jgi:pyruvate kinase